MNSRAKLLIISGLSGVGKGTIIKKYMEMYPNESVLSVSATTRCPRPGEEEGKAYFFKSKPEFEEMIANGRLLEYACYVDNYYGTPKEWVYEQLSAGKNVILEIEQQGALKVKEKEPAAVMVFVMPPSEEELIRRLKGRGSETGEQIRKRLKQAETEKEKIKFYDHVIVNEDIEKSAEMLHNIVKL